MATKHKGGRAFSTARGLIRGIKSASSQFICNLCSQYRQSLFRSDAVLMTLGSTKEMQKEKEMPEIYSDRRIDEVLSDFRQRKIIVKPVSSLPFKEEIEKLKQKYPANFQ